jgi:hypothetical protein
VARGAGALGTADTAGAIGAVAGVTTGETGTTTGTPGATGTFAGAAFTAASRGLAWSSASCPHASVANGTMAAKRRREGDMRSATLGTKRGKLQFG